MGSHEERLQILKMVQEGKISTEEGAKLLEAVEGSRERVAPAGVGSGGKWFRVRVTELQTGRGKINVNIPMGLVSTGAKIGARFAAPVEIDLDALLKAVEGGAEGKILDVENVEDDERIEIYVE